MKASGITRTTILSLLLGSVVLACAAQDRPPENKNHPKQDNKQQQVKPAQEHTQQARPSNRTAQPTQSQQRQPDRQQQRQPAQAQRQQRPNDSPQRVQQAPQEQRPTVSRQQEHDRQHRGAAPGQQDQGRGMQQSAWQQHRAGNWQSDHRTWQQRGGYSGYRIPDNRFRGYFGPDHGFRIQGLPFMVVGGYPRFQYGGYWLTVIDPWPADWDSDWYDNDQVYVTYVDNGYYLYNRSYPGVGIAVSISR